MAQLAPNNLENTWMGFTAGKAFKKNPLLVAKAKGMYYYKPNGDEVLDATSALWCCNAGHCHPTIVEAVQKQVAELDYATTFQFGHPSVFELGSRISELLPDPLDRIFFCNSGSESVDTSLKMALTYHRLRGEATRTRIIGRRRSYHGVGLGGISAGGMPYNSKHYGHIMSGVSHLPETYSREHQAYCAGQPAWGAHLADELSELVKLYDASTIAAVIVEPVAGSTGLLSPPVGYLDRLREICDKNGILLIFDEVITGFGRLGYASASEAFGVTPDLMTFAKAITSGVIPMGGVAVAEHVYQAFQNGPERIIDLWHGYTASGNPVAVAAALASLNVYRDEALFDKVHDVSDKFADAALSLRGEKHVVDIRSIGLTCAFDLESREGAVGERSYDAMVHAFDEEGMMIRVSGDTIILAPPLILEDKHIELMFDKLGKTLRAIA